MACEEVQRNTLVSLFAFCERVMFFSLLQQESGWF